MTAILVILFFHFVFDFFFQSHWMASNKSTSLKALSLHVAIYAIGLLLLAWILPFPTLVLGLCWAGANICLHFLTDFFTSKWTTCLWKKKQIHNFFVVIGFDQFLHYAALLSTWVYFN